MQTRDEVESLQNCLEFSQALECLYQAMQTEEKSFPVAWILFFLEKYCYFVNVLKFHSV